MFFFNSEWNGWISTFMFNNKPIFTFKSAGNCRVMFSFPLMISKLSLPRSVPLVFCILSIYKMIISNEQQLDSQHPGFSVGQLLGWIVAWSRFLFWFLYIRCLHGFSFLSCSTVQMYLLQDIRSHCKPWVCICVN